MIGRATDGVIKPQLGGWVMVREHHDWAGKSVYAAEMVYENQSGGREMVYCEIGGDGI